MLVYTHTHTHTHTHTSTDHTYLLTHENGLHGI